MNRWLKEILDARQTENAAVSRDAIEAATRNSSTNAAAGEEHSELSELEASIRRLEAGGISIAIFEKGAMRVVTSQAGSAVAAHDGGTVYSPADMLHYIELSQSERRMLHRFKKQFGASIEWKVNS